MGARCSGSPERSDSENHAVGALVGGRACRLAFWNYSSPPAGDARSVSLSILGVQACVDAGSDASHCGGHRAKGADVVLHGNRPATCGRSSGTTAAVGTSVRPSRNHGCQHRFSLAGGNYTHACDGAGGSDRLENWPRTSIRAAIRWRSPGKAHGFPAGFTTGSYLVIAHRSRIIRAATFASVQWSES